MKRSIVSLAIAAAMILPAAVSRPQPAAADYGVNIICPMQQSAFSGTFDHRVYSFTLACYGNQNFRVTASYDNTAKRASEKFVGTDASQGYLLEALWTCPTDPWGTYQEPVCTNLNSLLQPDDLGFLGSYDLSHSTLPYSAQSLSAQDQATLFDEATQAERQQSKQAQQPPVNTNLQHIVNTEACLACEISPNTSNFEATHLTSTVCLACIAAAGASPSGASGNSPSPAPACLICQIPGR